MKKLITLSSASILAFGLMSFEMLDQNGRTGRTTSGCGSCHGNSQTTAVTLSLTSSTNVLFSTGYTPGTVYTLNFLVQETNQGVFGLDVGASIGTLNAGTVGDTKKVGTEITHTGTGNTGNASHTFVFTWTAPASGSGPVTFNFAGLAGNNDGNNSSSDHWKTGSATAAQSTVGITEQIESNFNLNVFPNPVNEAANVSYSLAENSTVSANLINVTGQVVATFFTKEEQTAGKQNRKLLLDPSITKGIYFVAINVNGKNTYKKIVVE